MCGIAGLVGFPQHEQKQAIHQMVHAMGHRGPDASGIASDQLMTFGHTRLAVIDLKADSDQPFLSKDKRFTLVYNGEIYNYQQLKSELVEYNFQTNSDTEVVLASYLKWGESCLSKFNGMFAFAIWDKCEQSLFLARDRMGIKPLYYDNSRELIFASEIRTILSSGLADNKVHAASIEEFLTYQTVHPPNTIIENIKQIKPGHYGIYKNGSLKEFCYWKPTTSGECGGKDKNTISSEIRNLLYEAVERRMVSDVSIGAFLSGGIDSSIIVAAMSGISARPIDTFTLAFDQKEYDESYYSALVSKKFNTRHRQMRLKPHMLLDELPGALDAMDSPAGDCLNSYFISRFAKINGLTVALSGLGGDELFAGYPVFSQLHKISRSGYWSLPPSVRKLSAAIMPSVIEPGKKERLKQLLIQEKGTLKDLYPIFRMIYSRGQLGKVLHLTEGFSNSCFEEALRNASQFPMISKISMVEIMTYTQNVLLRDLDSMGMAHSLEARVPFLDHELIEYMMMVPDNFKEPFGTKRLLIDAFKGMLPGEVIHRKKQGFTFPWESLIRTDLQHFCNEQLSSLENYHYFNMSGVIDKWEKFKSGDRSVSWSQIWLLVVLSKWMNTYARG